MKLSLLPKLTVFSQFHPPLNANVLFFLKSRPVYDQTQGSGAVFSADLKTNSSQKFAGGVGGGQILYLCLLLKNWWDLYALHPKSQKPKPNCWHKIRFTLKEYRHRHRHKMGYSRSVFQINLGNFCLLGTLFCNLRM